MIALCAGSGSERTFRTENVEEIGDEEIWDNMGKQAFKGDNGEELRREVVQGVLGTGGTGGWCDSEVSFL